MNSTDIVKQHFSDSIQTKIVSADQLSSVIANAAEKMTKTLLDGGKILACGNGGSACDALHFAGELLNRLERERPSLPAIALNADVSTMTAIGNDYHYSQIFSKQIQALGQEGDLLLAITTSGNSENILEAIKTAHQRHVSVIILSGKSGGKCAELLDENDVEIRIPEERTMRIQETHILIIHCLCDLIDQSIFGEHP